MEFPPGGTDVDSVGVVTSFTPLFPLLCLCLCLSLPLLLDALPLLVSLNQQSLAMWPPRPHTKQLVFDPSVLLFPLFLPLPFFVKASISMSSGPLLLLGVTVTPAWYCALTLQNQSRQSPCTAFDFSPFRSVSPVAMHDLQLFRSVSPVATTSIF